MPANPNLITPQTASPGAPPQGLSMHARLRWSKTHPPIDPTVSFAGKTVLVTGANTGLGYEAAVKYAALGAEKLLIGVRSLAKGEETKARIVAQTGCQPERILILTVDLASYDSVRAFATAVDKATGGNLDVALLNAGLGNPTFETSSAGWEMAIQVNVLSTALMAVTLLPLLQASSSSENDEDVAAAHLTFVNSHGHSMVDREALLGGGRSLLQEANDKDTWETNKSYSLVKLMGIAVMLALARMTSTSTSSSSSSPDNNKVVIVNAVCPDMCKTDLGRKWSGLGDKIGKFVFYSIFARTAEEGSRTLVSGTALGPESHGKFWHHDVLYPLSDMAQDEKLMTTTWEEIMEAVVKDQPDARELFLK